MNETEKKTPSYRDKREEILPLPAFVTREPVERSADKPAGPPHLTFEDLERETMVNMNRMATDEVYRR
jgi:hypothetical protein